jgi:hypothetical protein
MIGALAASSPLWALGKDWPGWGGANPGRNMYSPERNIPAQFVPGTFLRGSGDVAPGSTENVRWIARLGSQSYGNPVVAGGKVFIGTNNDAPRDPQHQGDRSILMCFSEGTGELLWQLVVPKLRAGKVNDWDRLGIVSSPAVEGDRLYLVTTRGEVLCLDVNGMADGNSGPFLDEACYVVADTGRAEGQIGPKDADIIWRFDMMKELGKPTASLRHRHAEPADEAKSARCKPHGITLPQGAAPRKQPLLARQP